jgi:hypothetical protein
MPDGPALPFSGDAALNRGARLPSRPPDDHSQPPLADIIPGLAEARLRRPCHLQAASRRCSPPEAFPSRSVPPPFFHRLDARTASALPDARPHRPRRGACAARHVRPGRGAPPRRPPVTSWAGPGATPHRRQGRRPVLPLHHLGPRTTSALPAAGLWSTTTRPVDTCAWPRPIIFSLSG